MRNLEGATRHAASVRWSDVEYPLQVTVDRNGHVARLMLCEPQNAPLDLCERVALLDGLVTDDDDAWAALTALSSSSPRFAPIVDRVNEKLAHLAGEDSA